MRRILSTLGLAACLMACPKTKTPPGPTPTGRCDFDVATSGLFSMVGTGASARVVQGPTDLIGGQYAQAQVGDFLIQNDKIRAIIQQPGRFINPVLFGGILIDADVQRPAGEPGHDQFGRMGPLYSFGRTVNVTKVEILSDGTGGGPVVVAATGPDSLNNYAHISLVLSNYTGGAAQLVLDPEQALPLLVTTYYVLSPGESRVRMLSAFCNQGTSPIVIPVGDLIDQGGTTDYFDPQACTHVMGNRGCLVDPAPWYGYQGNDVAYGIREYRLDDPGTPDVAAIISVVGISGTVAGGQNQAGILSWLDPQAQTRPGSFGIRPGDQHVYLRDFFVGHSLGDITSAFTDIDNVGHARLEVSVTNVDGSVAAGAKIAVMDPATGNEVTLLVADAQGKAQADLPTTSYNIAAALPGHQVMPLQTVALPSSGTVQQSLQVGPAHMLTVNVQDGAGNPMPAKVTLICSAGTCPQPVDGYRSFWDTEVWPSNLADIELIPPQGTLTFPVAPGQYQVVVTRGPEYSVFPDTWPSQALTLDLTASDQMVTAVLGHVVDTSGWTSADLHVHAVDSSDSSVANDRRVLAFTAEGLNIIVSTDHDFITDYGPTIHALQADDYVASMIGDELSTFDFGHFNLYPLTVNPNNLSNGGAFDWGGEDNSHVMRLPDIFAGVRQGTPNAVIQINHGRGSLGVLTKLQIDTATGASHVDPALFRLLPAPNATANDTKLFSDNFDAMEVQNGLTASNALLNDWMTFISRGAVKTATAVSDSHYTLTYGAGDSRTYIEAPFTTPQQLDPNALSQAIKAHRAIGTNAPFVRLSGTRLDASGTAMGPTVGIGDVISINPTANEKLNLNVDVQSAEWVNFDSIEVYTYAPGRESTGGTENDNAPVMLAQQTLALNTLPIEAVPGPGSQTFRRIHVNTNFVVSPTADTWYMVMVRGSPAANSLFPMLLHGASCTGAICTANSSQAFAFTNPIYVDGDGDGLYDHFPIPAASPGPPPPPRPPAPRPARAPLTPAQLEYMLNDLRAHHCGG